MPDFMGGDIFILKTKISDNYCLLSLKNKSAETSNGERIFSSLYFFDICTYIPIIRYSFMFQLLQFRIFPSFWCF